MGSEPRTVWSGPVEWSTATPFAGAELDELTAELRGRGPIELIAAAMAGGSAVAGVALMAFGLAGVAEAAVVELSAAVFAILARP